MSMKKFDLAKSVALKVAGQMKVAGVPDRFAQGAAASLDKREQRKRDAAAGLVPFACKLPLALITQLNERAADHEAGVNGLVAQWLSAGLQTGTQPAAVAQAARAKKPAAAIADAVSAPAEKSSSKAKAEANAPAPAVPASAAKPKAASRKS